MDVNTITQLFEQVGLTACIIGGFAWYIVKKDKDKALVDQEIRERQMAERDMLIATIEKYRVTNEALLQTNKELSESNRLMLNEFGNKINNIENSVVKFENKISNIESSVVEIKHKVSD